jgi:hypothetical protein
MIDGRPAGETLAAMRQQALEGGPAQTYGADVATRNIASMGVNDAVADYFQRNRLDAERPQRAADARAAAAEPGSMFERSRPEMAGPPATGVVGPAQRAMLDARENPNVPYQAPDAGLLNARSVAAGAAVMRTPTAGSLLQRPDLAMRSDEYVNAATGRVDKPFQLSKTDRLGGYKRVGIAGPDVWNASLEAFTADYKNRKAQRESTLGQRQLADTQEQAVTTETNNYDGRLSAKLYGPGGYQDPKVAAELSRQAAAKKAREEKNAAQLSKGSTRPPLLSRTIGEKPSWMQGTLAGRAYDAINK